MIPMLSELVLRMNDRMIRKGDTVRKPISCIWTGKGKAGTREDIMRKKLAGLLAVVVAVSTVLSGCGTYTSSDSGDLSSSTAAPAEAGTSGAAAASTGTSVSTDSSTLNLRILSDPTTLDPQSDLSDAQGILYSLIYEPLARLDKNGKATPAQATDWSVSKDGLTYTFNLRDDNYWSNGDPVTAEDYVYAWKRIAGGKIGTMWADLMFDIKGMQEAFAGTGSQDDIGVKADGNKLVVTLNEPRAYFPGYTAFSIFQAIDPSYAESQGDKFGTDAVIGNGPYYVDSWKHDNLLVLKRNKHYWNKDAYKFDKINVYVIGDDNTATNMFTNGELDEVELNGTKADQVKSAGYDVKSYDSGRSVYLLSNMNSDLIKNDNIRKGISCAIDRETIVKNVLRDASKPATGYVTEEIAGADGKTFRELAGDTLTYTYDKKKAKEYFDAGLKELGLKASDVKIELLARNDDEQKLISATIQETLQETFGITVNVTNLDPTQYTDRRKNLGFDLCLISWGGDWDDASTFLHLFYHPGEKRETNDFVTYVSKDFDDTYEKSIFDTSATAAQRAQYLVDSEKILMRDLPIIPLYFKGQYYATQPNVKGINHSSVTPYIHFEGASKS